MVDADTETGTSPSTRPTPTTPSAAGRSTGVRYLGLGAVWVGLLAVMLRPTPHRLAATLPNDLGDPNFVTWTMRWGWRALLTQPWNVFDAPIYFPAPDSLAYSETFLTFAPAFGLVEAITGDHVLALNLLTVALFALSLVATYLLARYVLGRTAPSVLAAAVFTFTSYSLGQQSHLQVLTFGMFPLGIWLLLRYLDRGGWWDAIALGALTAGFVYASVYYALLWVLVVPGIVVVLVLCRTPVARRTWTRGLIVGAGVGLLCLPAGLHYLEVSGSAGIAFPYDAIDAMQWRDLLTPAAGNVVWSDSLDGINSDGVAGDHGFMMSLTAYALAVGGIVLLIARRGRLPVSDLADDQPDRVVDRSHALWAILVVAVGSFVVGVGPTFQGYAAPYRVLHKFVPGFEGIRSASRLSIVFFLGIALLAAVGAGWVGDALARRTGRRRLGTVAIGALLVVAMAEVAVDSTRVAPWEGDDIEALYAAVEDLPDGAVMEWPTYSITDGFQWPFVEAPRMALSADDADHPRLNGYSGHWPGGYVERSAVLRGFPSDASLEVLDQLGIRYVVIHSTSPWDGAPLDPEAVDDVLESLPAGLEARRVGVGWIIDLGGVQE